MKRRIANWLMRVGYRMLCRHSVKAGIIVNPGGKWQAIKL